MMFICKETGVREWDIRNTGLYGGGNEKTLRRGILKDANLVVFDCCYATVS